MTKPVLIALFVAAVTSAVPTDLRASGIQLVDVFQNQIYTQTSGAAPASASGFFADVELTSQNPGDFNSVSVSFPGPASPVAIPLVSPTFFSYGPSFATLAAMNAAIPFGNYNFTATNGAVTDQAALDYAADAYASAIPALAGATFSALNGLNTGSALTIAFNSFTPAANASQGFEFFSISDAGGTVFTDGFLAPSTTSLVLPANTLASNTTYTFELDFSDRQNGMDPASGVFTVVGSDLRTDGTFTTGAIPAASEPGTILLLASGVGTFAVKLRSKRRRDKL